MEYGIATVMEQYDKKYKARQLLGPISEELFNSPANIQTPQSGTNTMNSVMESPSHAHKKR